MKNIFTLIVYTLLLTPGLLISMIVLLELIGLLGYFVSPDGGMGLLVWFIFFPLFIIPHAAFVVIVPLRLYKKRINKKLALFLLTISIPPIVCCIYVFFALNFM